MEPDDPGYRGQADYTPALLVIYDKWVLGFMTGVVWKSPTHRMVERYRRLVGQRHLDVGPGTGYFLERANLTSANEVTLIDPNTHVLAYAGKRLRGLNVRAIEADVMKPLPVSGPFDSAALHGVLHCLAGPMPNKAAAIRNVAATLAPDGVLFGTTVLGLTEKHTTPARLFLRAFNRRGTFDNRGDTLQGLRAILEASFHEVETEISGSFADFVARRPRRGEPA